MTIGACAAALVKGTAANGALQAAGAISVTAMSQVRNVVTQTISGARAVLQEPIRSGAEAPHSA